MVGKLSVVPHNPNAQLGFNQFSYYRACVGELTFMLAISPAVKGIKSIRYDKAEKDFEVELFWEQNGKQSVETEFLGLVHSARKWFYSGPIVEALKSVDRWEINA